MMSRSKEEIWDDDLERKNDPRCQQAEKDLRAQMDAVQAMQKNQSKLEIELQQMEKEHMDEKGKLKGEAEAKEMEPWSKISTLKEKNLCLEEKNAAPEDLEARKLSMSTDSELPAGNALSLRIGPGRCYEGTNNSCFARGI
mmetsp:Transcript_24918/g.59937  ORF Transcript_24918/g.59937 Transcript_24918/m.59937 type:complete len:141 (+) Transcript_24918:245-667(+)